MAVMVAWLAMNSQCYILVTGGAGFIGSHMCKMLHQAGYNVVVFDNLRSGHKAAVKYGKLVIGDLADCTALRAVFNKYNVTAVFHFASFISVAESIADPGKYYHNNIANSLNLLQVMRQYKVNKLIFSSTAAVYGQPLSNPIAEDHPKNPLSPYGTSKLYIENILADFAKAYNFNYVALRYFNAAGADPEGELGENHQPETHLIPLMVQLSIRANNNELKIYGNDYDTHDGSCIRDYIHVHDLCAAHLLALQYLNNNGKAISLNLGNGAGYSVKEIAASFQELLQNKYPQYNFKINTVAAERRPGDPGMLVADATAAQKVLGWQCNYPDITTIIDHTFRWQCATMGAL